MNITFIGSGYVGLVSGIIMGYLGHNVTCLDNDDVKISKLNKKILPIYEAKLDEYLKHALESDRLKFTNIYSNEFRNFDAIFITVGTPSKELGEADLKYVYDAVDKVSKHINKDCLIVIKSTVPPGSCNNIIAYLKAKGFSFNVASNPEFLREGSAVEDFLYPDRIVVGVNNKESEALLRKIYAPLIEQGAKFLVTNLVTSELIKYVSNSFLATKIAFINEMADLCEKIGANIKDLSQGVGLDQRIGRNFLNAGPGFGGSCFPKDILALNNLVENHKIDCKILKSVIKSNKLRPSNMVAKIATLLDGDLKGRNIAILGLTYKAGTDDVRASPAIEIITILLNKDVYVKAFDPIGLENAKKNLEHKNLLYFASAVEACKSVDIIVIATEWSEFKELNWQEIYNLVKSPMIIDLRNILDNEVMKKIGFRYYAVGSQI
ncbi:UDP-glucose dehydrogenase family protein [Rickettsia prowazekii]|uniref:UDP-glucose 6-dehydrogenase n=2 Tax=Rickettsia prowazekii TaxID=782 RepID=UDG_RICPR|nr:UDP-glucose/GDP-mannose dehydrogenase family protein [Rickettsia prowazekii]O05973.1 RecName: Full=UDP-glucose 6-dehydrogenase; Short=UDP-Glc dehydrogenase; Short=UDP-GlcDH; Short=UDPGDH [Rickettsia prowazekii str. Madrid E]EOB10299.1 UDP-glucose 6-dehydrogenase [Rickettsia prowazekii str. GvF12]ADE30344.1 UDP-glucose 6-dehydrogenase [Rickettsia prowazekii str. Rp22]AFE49575.1 UDP-glucose 6-dehydrogenase [Rickettsia prowazekii str. Chernikova]AFE50419.1 UDP-glucose 6-dehydrogenase [Ricketts